MAPSATASSASPIQFGPAIASVDVDQAVLGTLARFMPRYLAHLDDVYDLPFSLKAPDARNYVNVLANEEWPDNSLPQILVATAHTIDAPVMWQDGQYTTTWLVAVSAVVRGRKAAETRLLASLYELALRMVLVQHSSLGDFARDLRWVAGGEAHLLRTDTSAGRYLGEGASQFHVMTDGNVQAGMGPRVPAQPEGDRLTVGRITLDIGGSEVDESP